MSKAFTRESDDGPDEVVAMADLALAPGEENYVTPAGAARLRAEIDALREAPRTDARQRLVADQRLAALLRRLEQSEVVDPLAQPKDRALFGATVTVVGEDERERRYRIVGIDEADARRGRLSWRSPVARALLGRRVGDVATVRTPSGEEQLEIVRIAYEADD